MDTLADKLPYFGFDSETGAIWLKDGSATLSLKITPRDCSSLTDDDLEQLRFGLTPVLGHLPEGSVFQALLIRERSKAETDEVYCRWKQAHVHAEDPIRGDARQSLFEFRRALLEKKFESGNVFQTRCYITLRILPVRKASLGKTLGGFAHLASRLVKGVKHGARTRQEILHDLESGLGSLQVGLEALGFNVTSVAHEERMRVIYEWFNPERAKSLPAPTELHGQTLSDRVALSDLIEDKAGLAIGRTRIAIASLKSLPEVSIPAAVSTLSSVPIAYSLFFTIYVLPQTEERERLIRKQRLAQGMASGNLVRNLMAEAQLKDIEDTLTSLISSGEKLLAGSFQMVGLGAGTI